MSHQGGMVNSLHALITNLDSPAKLIYGVILILIIVYSSLIPSEYRIFVDSLLGRVFGIGIIYGVIQTLGWVYGLLTALAFLLVLNGHRIEGFDGSITSYKGSGDTWYVEKVLNKNNQNQQKIKINEVRTEAIK
jgi:hypothetical protein